MSSRTKRLLLDEMRGFELGNDLRVVDRRPQNVDHSRGCLDVDVSRDLVHVDGSPDHAARFERQHGGAGVSAQRAELENEMGAPPAGIVGFHDGRAGVAALGVRGTKGKNLAFCACSVATTAGIGGRRRRRRLMM